MQHRLIAAMIDQRRSMAHLRTYACDSAGRRKRIAIKVQLRRTNRREQFFSMNEAIDNKIYRDGGQRCDGNVDIYKHT
jgi:hypothetical protein